MLDPVKRSEELEFFILENGRCWGGLDPLWEQRLQEWGWHAGKVLGRKGISTSGQELLPRWCVQEVEQPEVQRRRDSRLWQWIRRGRNPRVFRGLVSCHEGTWRGIQVFC